VECIVATRCIGLFAPSDIRQSRGQLGSENASCASGLASQLSNMGKTHLLSPRHRPLLLCTLGLTFLFGYLLAYHLHHQGAQKGHLGDFPTFYQAAQLARNHQDMYLANQHGQQPYIYPPLTAVLYIPFTYLTLPAAARLMLLLTAAMLIASLLLISQEMLRRLGGTTSATAVAVVALIVAVLNEDQLRAVLTMLETDALMLLLFTLALRWLDRAPLRAGAALAFALNIKYLSIVMLPYLLLRRRWRVAAAMIVGSITFALLPALHLGWHEDLRCLRVSTAGLLGWIGIAPPPSVHAVYVFKITDALSFSLTSGVARVLAAHHCPGGTLALALAAIALLSLAIANILYRFYGFSFWRSPRAGNQTRQPYLALTGIEWTLLIAAILSFSPQTNARHLILSVIVNAAIAALLLQPPPVRGRVLLVAALFIIFCSKVMPTSHQTHRAEYFGLPGAGVLVGSLIFLAVALRHLKTRSAVPS